MLIRLTSISIPLQLKRPAEKAAMDVKNEYITVEQAKADYGVWVDPETFKVLGLTEESQKAEK
jgi:N-methylhydantoinase B